MTGQNEKPLRLPKPLSLRAPQGRGNPIPAMRSIALTVRSIIYLNKTVRQAGIYVNISKEQIGKGFETIPEEVRSK